MEKSLKVDYDRCVNGGWAEWAIAHPGFGRGGNNTLDSYLRPVTL